MSFVIENLRLKELALVAEQNRPAFEDFVNFLSESGFSSLQAFVLSKDAEKAGAVIYAYLARPLPSGVALYDGVARAYASDKAKWLLLGWILGTRQNKVCVP